MKKQLFIFLTVLFLTGCNEDYINLNPITSASTERFYNTSNDFINAVNATYGVLQNMYRSQYYFGDIPTDDALAHTGTCINGACDFDNFVVNPAESAASNVLSNRWNDAYRGISRSNTILDRIDAVEMNANLKARLKGEAKFLRALYYFNLVQIFGEVPLVVHELKTTEESYSYGKESVNKVYAQIGQDLKDAAAALPQRYSGADVGRATAGAAKGLLSRVLLFQEKHAAALPLLKEIIDSKTYSLLPTFSDVFRHDNGNNAEILFSVQYTKGGLGEGNNIVTQFAPQGSGNAVIVGGGGTLNQPTADILNAFESGDKRKNATIATSYLAANGKPVNIFFVSKFLDPAMNAPQETETDYPVLRYSDVLLMYAESLNETGNTSEAHQYLNMVRNRAGLASKEGLSQSAMRLVIEQERRVELAFEGLRFFDLVRTNRLLPVMNEYFQKNNLKVNGQIIQVKDYQKIFPIPQSQIDINSTKITQNPGY
ncbi:RagB/SusD family nutrient uptake outer membrane protein [Telluribacter sp.]|jgi:hypothetical protein|uniref:RagB/SusD family nutrient uptake outer membrane protein n=1 Tax=Telluribacter sp. TaxID=1978767 RepID=UPI002E0DB387|nr:RagB/SusD family nutrient uptake outer membrane protein [Telluribacter sp.]